MLESGVVSATHSSQAQIVKQVPCKTVLTVKYSHYCNTLEKPKNLHIMAFQFVIVHLFVDEQVNVLQQINIDFSRFTTHMSQWRDPTEVQRHVLVFLHQSVYRALL